MILFELFFRFFLIGLFSVGGGLATLPFLYEMSQTTGWFTTQDISNLVAISESTPGPMGVNMSTYVGFVTSGVPGAIIGPLGLITPSIIIIIIVSMFLKRFKESETVQNVFYGLRPASAALIASAGFGILKLAFIGSEFNFDVLKSFSFFASLLLAGVLYFAMKKFKLHPVVYIAISAVIGVLLKINIE